MEYDELKKKEAYELAEMIIEAMNKLDYPGAMVPEKETEEGVWYHLFTHQGEWGYWVTREQLDDPIEMERVKEEFREILRHHLRESKKEKRERN